MITILKLIRVKQWIKNFFLFVPSFFAGKIFDFDILLVLGLAFLSYSLIASSIYIVNDLKDIENDRLHPTKRNRPLASGKISPKQGIYIFVVLVVTGFFLAFQIDISFLLIVAFYFLLNLSYSLGLKNISILDVIIVSLGFVLRIRAGGVAVGIGVSIWLTTLVFLLAMFLALAKRRDDIILKNSLGSDLRKASKGYNLDFLTVSMTLIVAVAFMSYMMYTLSPQTIQNVGTHRLYITGVFVLAGILRYLQLTYIDNDTGSPTQILYKDRFIILSIAGWGIVYLFILYFPKFSLL